jgi:hypothetical protein
MFALWCLRERLARMQGRDGAPERLDEGFALAGLQAARPQFERLFAWLTGTASRPIRLGAPTCGVVSRDEALLLAALAAFQRGEAGSGELLLGCFMPRVACLHAATAGSAFAVALSAAELPIGQAGSQSDRDGRPAANDAPLPAADRPVRARAH